MQDTSLFEGKDKKKEKIVATEPLPSNTKPDTVETVTVRNQRDRRSMSRRSGQSGSVYVKGPQYIGRYRADVPGQNKRVRRTVIIGNIEQFTRPKAERWLSKFIEDEGINDASHLARSQSPVVTFGLAARDGKIITSSSTRNVRLNAVCLAS